MYRMTTRKHIMPFPSSEWNIKIDPVWLHVISNMRLAMIFMCLHWSIWRLLVQNNLCLSSQASIWTTAQHYRAPHWPMWLSNWLVLLPQILLHSVLILLRSPGSLNFLVMQVEFHTMAAKCQCAITGIILTNVNVWLQGVSPSRALS